MNPDLGILELLSSPSQGDCLLDNAFNCFGGSLGVIQPLKIGEIGRLQQTVKLNVCACVFVFPVFFFFAFKLTDFIGLSYQRVS